jgi:hypothetical protein
MRLGSFNFKLPSFRNKPEKDWDFACKGKVRGGPISEPKFLGSSQNEAILRKPGSFENPRPAPTPTPSQSSTPTSSSFEVSKGNDLHRPLGELSRRSIDVRWETAHTFTGPLEKSHYRPNGELHKAFVEKGVPNHLTVLPASARPVERAKDKDLPQLSLPDFGPSLSEGLGDVMRSRGSE